MEEKGILHYLLDFLWFSRAEREKHRITRLNNVRSKISNMSTKEMKTLLLSTRALYFACRLRPPTAAPMAYGTQIFQILSTSEWRRARLDGG